MQGQGPRPIPEDEQEREPIEIDNEVYLEGLNLKRIPLKDLVTSHRKRWVIPTNQGHIVLKKISQLDLEEVYVELSEIPEYVELSRSSRAFSEDIQSGKTLTPQGRDELNLIIRKLRPYAIKFQMKCIISPKVKTIEEYDALATALDNKSFCALQDLLVILMNPRPVGDVNAAVLEIAKDHGIKLADDLTVENMTAEQVTGLIESKNRQVARVKREIEKEQMR